jgi:hypothetical protein
MEFYGRKAFVVPIAQPPMASVANCLRESWVFWRAEYPMTSATPLERLGETDQKDGYEYRADSCSILPLQTSFIVWRGLLV